MAGKLRIVDFRSEHWPGLVRLYEKYFGAWNARRFRQRWQWQFQENPFTEERPAITEVAMVDDILVGHIAGYPLPIQFGADRKVFLAGSDLVVDEGYRASSLLLLKRRKSWRPLMDAGFTGPVEQLLKAFRFQFLPLSRIRLDYSLRYTSAMQRALRKRLPSSLQWLESRTAASVLGRVMKPRWVPVRKPPPRITSRFDIQRIPRFGEEYDQFWFRLRNSLGFSIDRDSRYMNWRYVDGPFETIRCWKAVDRSDQMSGVVVVGLRMELDDDRVPCGKGGEILELLAPPSNQPLVHALAAHAVNRLDADRVDSVSGLGLTAEVHEPLVELGFELRERSRHSLAFDPGQLDGLPADLVTDRSWYISSGDGDQTYGTIV